VCWVDGQFRESAFKVPTFELPEPFRCSSVRVGGPLLVRRQNLPDVVCVHSKTPVRRSSSASTSAAPLGREIILMLSFEALREPRVTDRHVGGASMRGEGPEVFHALRAWKGG
jgi:hypothetical protein